MSITSVTHINEVMLRFDATEQLIGMQYKQIQIVQDTDNGIVYSATELGPFNIDTSISENVSKILGDALIAANGKIASLSDEVAQLKESTGQIDLMT